MIRIALTELRRVPRRFVPLLVTMTAVVFLATAVSALADGLLRASTGALRNTDADIYVFADGAQRSVFRSVLPDVLTIPISHQAGVTNAGAMGFAPTAVTLPGSEGPVSVVAVSVSHALAGRPSSVREGRIPFDGEPRVVTIDSRLAEQGAGVGDRIQLETFSAEVVGIVDDASYLLRPTIWLPPSEFAVVRNAALPEFDVDESLTSVIAVQISSSASVEEIIGVIDDAFAEALDELEELDEVEGGIESVSARDAYRAIPGVGAQQSTLRTMVVVVLALVAAVVLIFASVLNLERRPLLASLLAAGVPMRAITGLLVIQTVAVTLVGVAIALVGTALLARVAPDTVPLHLDPRSIIVVVGGATAAAATGALVSSTTLRRVDPVHELRSS